MTTTTNAAAAVAAAAPPAWTVTPQPITAPVERTHGHAKAPTIMHKYPVDWELDPATGIVAATFDHTAAYLPSRRATTAPQPRMAGRVIESIPGKLYYFQDRQDAERGTMWGGFPTADSAAKHGAVRYTLGAVRGY